VANKGKKMNKNNGHNWTCEIGETYLCEECKTPHERGYGMVYEDGEQVACYATDFAVLHDWPVVYLRMGLGKAKKVSQVVLLRLIMLPDGSIGTSVVTECS